jgi:hypothetical protein
MKYFFLILLLIIIVFNFILIKKSYFLLSFYLESIPRNPYLKFIKEIKKGQTINTAALQKEHTQNKHLNMLAVSVECSTCTALISSFSNINDEIFKFIIISNGILPERQREILIRKKIHFIESKEIFEEIGIRSVPKLIKVNNNVVSDINTVSNWKELKNKLVV